MSLVLNLPPEDDTLLVVDASSVAVELDAGKSEAWKFIWYMGAYKVIICVTVMPPLLTGSAASVGVREFSTVVAAVP